MCPRLAIPRAWCRAQKPLNPRTTILLFFCSCFRNFLGPSWGGGFVAFVADALSNWFIFKGNFKDLAGEEGKNKGKQRETEALTKLKTHKRKFSFWFCNNCYKIGEVFAEKGLERPIWQLRFRWPDSCESS